MKGQVVLAIVVAFVAGSIITAVPAVDAQGGWKPAIENLQNQIDSFFDIFVTVDVHDTDITNLQTQIVDLQASPAVSCENQFAMRLVASNFLVSSECITLEGTLAFAKKVAGTGPNGGDGITPLSDNSVVVTGFFSGTGPFGVGDNAITLTSAGTSDIFVAKYNPDGTLAFAKRAGGIHGDSGEAITTLSDNSVVVTGHFSKTATFGAGESGSTTLTSAGTIDMFLAKYNPDGTLAFAKRAGGTGGERAEGIITLSDNSVVVAGQYTGTATFGAGESGSTTLTSAGTTDMFLAKYNPDGTLAFVKSAGGTGFAQSKGITLLSDGSMVVIGLYSGTATFGAGESGSTTLTSAGFIDTFVAKYNHIGEVIFAKSAGGGTNTVGLGITTLSDNSVVVTGRYRDTATFGAGESGSTTLTSAGGDDMFLAKYNPDGTLAFVKSAGGTDFEAGRSITTLFDNSVVITGDISGTATFGAGDNAITLTSAGETDIFVAKYNPDGTLAFVKSAGGTDFDRGHEITTLSDGSVVVTGRYSDTAIFGAGVDAITLTFTGDQFGMFVAKYN